jgi:tetratricopeptide (TPR) repeat protein
MSIFNTRKSRETDFRVYPCAWLCCVTVCLLFFSGCAKRPSGEAVREDAGARPSRILGEGVSLFKECEYEEALPLLERAASDEPGNLQSREWLAAVYYRLRRMDDAAAAAREALAIDRCSSHAHAILADTYNPQYSSWDKANTDTAWHHLHAAIACDSSNGSAWMGMWCETLRRGEYALSDTALRMMVRTGFLTPSLLAYNRWMLQHLPENALLLTNGDMDTYPAVALQLVEDLRRDVVIANRSLLNTKWYMRYIRNQYHVPLPFADVEIDSLRPYYDEEREEVVWLPNQLFDGWLEMKQRGAFPRSIAVSTTVEVGFYEKYMDHFKLAGAYRLYVTDSVEARVDTAAVRMSLASIDPDDFTGSFVSPLDRSPVRISHSNYLASNVTITALQYAMAVLESGRASEAFGVLLWAEEFEKKTVAGPVHAERIETFKKRIEERIQ